MLDSTRGAFSGLARGVATFVVIGSMVGVGVLIVLMIHESALHMQENWVHYEASRLGGEPVERTHATQFQVSAHTRMDAR